MKNYLQSDIKGRGFFKTYILFYIAIVIISVIVDQISDTMPGVSAIFNLGQSYISILLGFAFFYYAIQFISYREKGFGFTGSLGNFAPKALKWFLLTVITLGIYSPWYIKNLANYYLENTKYEDKSGELLSRPETLLKYMLLMLYLPLIVLTVIFIFFIFSSVNSYRATADAAVAVPAFIYVIFVFLVIIPFIFFYLAWIINVRYGSNHVAFKRSLSETAGFIVPQILLSIITIFIYYPAAIVKLYRFVAEGSDYTNEETGSKGGFGFSAATGEGFGVIWGQLLLSIITLGIYVPWAMSKVTNWFLNNTYVETNETV